MPKRAKNRPSLTLRQFADWGKASSRLSGRMLRQAISGVSIDSRTAGKGDVFVALTTEKDDGHRYVSAALERGAIAALVQKRKWAQFSEKDRTRLIAVDDPLRAVQRIAAAYRTALDIPIIGITGSSGKTTARIFIAETLKRGKIVGETSGNLNNHIGVPISLLRFTGNEEVGVIEMGANHTREIHELSNIVRPTIGVITSVGYAHIGYFGSLKNILKAKLEIIDGMAGDGGFVMLNGDDRYDVDQATNPNSVILNAGGEWVDGSLISGGVTTISVSPISQWLMRAVHSGIKKHFTRVQAFWVGPEALAALRSGKRLTYAVQSPPEYDLLEVSS